jgi:hypothetical protein
VGNVHQLPAEAANEAGMALGRPLQVATSRFVTIKLAAALTGLTVGAIEMKIAKGVWLEDKQYVRRDGRVLIDLLAYEPPPSPQERQKRAAAVKGALRAKRRASEICRTPSWADLKAIRAIYAQAQALTRATGIPHHVDHEIPLQGKLVSGLHVHNNLQILTGSENSKKHNRFAIEP